MPRPPDYGIIFNNDGDQHGFSEVPQSMEVLLDKVYAQMEGTQVGAHFWCVGTHAARWNSEVMEMVGDTYGRRYESAGAYRTRENVRQMLERGEDPQEAIIKRGHELGLHVWASVRMNDNHIMIPVEDIGRRHLSQLTRMRIEHPEWLLGDQASFLFATSWNFEVPEVRAHRFAHVEEVCRLYDWDGVELDWQRHPIHLPRDYEYRLRYVLTDLHRALRRMTNELGEKRGRPFYVAARVYGNPEMCLDTGYDVPAWIEENLVDMLVLDGTDSYAPLDVAELCDLSRGTDVVVYVGLDRIDRHFLDRSTLHMGPEVAEIKDKMRNRAIASRHYRAGAHGIQAFNWQHCFPEATRRELLRQMGSPETLRRTDKIYAAPFRYLGEEHAEASDSFRDLFRRKTVWGEVPVALKPTLTGDGPTTTLDVADDLSIDVPERVELRVRLNQWVTGDVVRVSWDGAELEGPTILWYGPGQSSHYGPDDSTDFADVSDAAWLCFEMDPARVGLGPHKVKVALVERHPKLACDIMLTDVELLITYGAS